ncbi:hypothetical protein SASPL_123117 [Salvia splendens]|uniref:Fe2OG dioxygenase domain-containing protein n=1 Tax=Salvia splendens TaxID=180675 RepID=A0A8X8XL43_SALSN|nr:hypothetical protein SASPL_123117 [Salvia splendens]
MFEGASSPRPHYPACPEPQLAIGTTKHSDPGFLTILLQSQLVSALQVFYKDSWLDIQPVQGALVINIGDLLQLVSNGKYRSNEHRVIANPIGPRISVACFFSRPFGNTSRSYGPIQELITQENPAIYKVIVIEDYLMKFLNSGLDSYRALDYYRVTKMVIEMDKASELKLNYIWSVLSFTSKFMYEIIKTLCVNSLT